MLAFLPPLSPASARASSSRRAGRSCACTAPRMGPAASTPGAAEPAESSWASSAPDRLRCWRDVRARLVAAEKRAASGRAGAPPRTAGPRDKRAAASKEHEEAEDEDEDEDEGEEESRDQQESEWQLPAVWAHTLPRVEVGACLVASRTHAWPKATEYLRYAVVLVTDVDPVTGVQGLLLNRSTGRTVGRSPGVLARVGVEFAGNAVLLGGDCCMGHLEVLHARREIVGAREVMPGLYRGGVNACRSMVATGQASAADFHIMISYTRWTWEQLAEEMGLNAWDIAAASPSMLLPQPRGLRDADGKSHWDELRRQLRASGK